MSKILRLRPTFGSPYTQFRDYLGLRFTILGQIDPKSYDYAECGPMYAIRLENGAELEAWPEELFEGMQETAPRPLMED